MKSKRLAVVSAAMFAGVWVAGCPLTPVTPAEAVLEGTWEGTAGDIEIVATFNSSGELVQVQATAVGGGTATRTINDAETTLEGNEVTVTFETETGTATYDATLSDDENSMSGSLSRSINVGSTVVITVPAGDLDLTRQGTNGNGNQNGNGNGNDNTGGGDATAGATTYAANCQVCHGANGAGGSAPNIQGATAAEIESRAVDGTGHPVIAGIDAQDVLDLEAYLATF